MIGRSAKRFRLVLLPALGALAGACFHLTGPEDAPAVSPPKLVSVTIEYRQPPGCLGGGHCPDRVVFFGSWMKPGTEFALTPDPGNYTWRGVALGVPVNYPPHEPPTPYEVRIYDPHLLASPTDGYTAEHITVGGESLSKVVDPGRPNVHSLVYVDQDGLGHNAY